VQRLFSTFADGWPGAGLLIQRLVVGTMLLYIDFACLDAKSLCVFAVTKSIAALAGVLLMAGLWTPIVGILVAGVETWIVLSANSSTVIPLVLAVLGLTLAMIGPGTWSVDALLYGRRRITFPER
jgi:putative oxidoreductase